MKIVVPATLTLPDGGPLSPIMMSSLVLDAALLNRTAHSLAIDQTIARVLALDLLDYPELTDTSSLSVKPAKLPTQARLIEKAAFELRLLSSVRAYQIDAVRDCVVDLAQLAIEVHRRVGSAANGFRTQSVAVGSIADDNLTHFIHHTTIAAQLARASAFVNGHSGRSPSLAAIVAYVAIIHAHPFMDGNGRTARTIYNLVLSARRPEPWILPVEAYSVLSIGALVLKVRRAMFSGRWDDLQRFFLGAVRLTP